MDAMTSVLNTVSLLAMDRDGKLREMLFRIDCTAFKVWAHGVDLPQATSYLPEGATLTQTITLSIGKEEQGNG